MKLEKVQRKTVSVAPAAYLLSAHALNLGGAAQKAFGIAVAADFQVGASSLPPAGLETCGTADLEVCAALRAWQALNAYPAASRPYCASSIAVARRRSEGEIKVDCKLDQGAMNMKIKAYQTTSKQNKVNQGC